VATDLAVARRRVTTRPMLTLEGPGRYLAGALRLLQFVEARRRPAGASGPTPTRAGRASAATCAPPSGSSCSCATLTPSGLAASALARSTAWAASPRMSPSARAGRASIRSSRRSCGASCAPRPPRPVTVRSSPPSPRPGTSPLTPHALGRSRRPIACSWSAPPRSPPPRRLRRRPGPRLGRAGHRRRHPAGPPPPGRRRRRDLEPDPPERLHDHAAADLHLAAGARLFASPDADPRDRAAADALVTAARS
jgi:hypothetical protein